MNPEALKEFLGRLKDTDIEELSLETGGTKIFFRKSEVTPVAPPPPTRASVAAAAAKQAAAEEKKSTPIKSPMVGTFYHSASPDHPPFVIEGNHIVPGQKIGFIEAMKIIKDVTADVAGMIVKVSVRNGQSVEYGQELFLVDATNYTEK
ncbi:MAG: biotin/lipoyl-containing protein [Endomicrobiales bacterium]|jgi:acetyl-CoA carboxylase biotin carboxyl carrier protein